MKKIGLFLIVAMTIAFASCKKDDTTSDYDKGIEKGESVYDYTDLIYSEDTGFSIPTTVTLENASSVIGLVSLYNTYNDNSANEEWNSGFKNGVASGILGEAGATQLISFFDDSETATLISALYDTATL